jgi:hypothetical protein
MMGRDWLAMAPSDFDTSADDGDLSLFDLDPATAPLSDDGCGTGDLLEEVDPQP